MEKICKCFEKLDVVKVLQYTAVAIYAAFLAQIIVQLFKNNFSLLDGFLVVTFQLIHALYQPVILLALAEVVKLMRKRSEPN